MKHLKYLISAIALSTAFTTTNAVAENYPEEPIKMIVAYSPGGGNDTVARLMAQHIEPYLGTNMVVVNHPGASGQIGFTRLAKSDNDGYTIGLLSAPSMFLVKLLRDDVAYSLEGLQAIANIQTDPILLAVNASSDYEDFESFINVIEKEPGPVNVSGDGPQSNVQLQAAAFEDALGLDINFVSYSGSGPAATALLGNEVEAAFLTASSATPFIKSGRIKPLAIFSKKAHPTLSDIPTIAEASGKEVSPIGAATRGVAAPAGVPAERVQYLEEAFKKLLQDEEFLNAAKKMGIVTTYMGNEEFKKMLHASKEETKQYVDVMK